MVLNSKIKKQKELSKLCFKSHWKRKSFNHHMFAVQVGSNTGRHFEHCPDELGLLTCRLDFSQNGEGRQVIHQPLLAFQIAFVENLTVLKLLVRYFIPYDSFFLLGAAGSITPDPKVRSDIAP